MLPPECHADSLIVFRRLNILFNDTYSADSVVAELASVKMQKTGLGLHFPTDCL
jgi:hypothetical protein